MLSSEISRYLSPFFRWPLDDGVLIGVVLQPCLCPFDKLIQGFTLLVPLQGGLALLPLHPQLCIHAVAVDGHGVQSLLFQQGKSMHDCQELPDVVRAPYRAIVEAASTAMDSLMAGFTHSS